MKIIDITGKFGSGKSFYAEKICEHFQNSEMITIDNIFEKLMNSEEIINELKREYPEKDDLINDKEINLDLILNDKEVFNKIYSLIENDLNQEVENKLNKLKENKKDVAVVEWWGLPRTNLMNLSDCTVYVDTDFEKRLEFMKKKKHIDEDLINKRDEVLNAQYDSCDFDITIKNDGKETTVNKIIEMIEKEIRKSYYEC